MDIFFVPLIHSNQIYYEKKANNSYLERFLNYFFYLFVGNFLFFFKTVFSYSFKN